VQVLEGLPERVGSGASTGLGGDVGLTYSIAPSQSASKLARSFAFRES
jgi:hypothetical protein